MNNIFLSSLFPITQENHHKSITHSKFFSPTELQTGQVPGITSYDEETTGPSVHFTIGIDTNIKRNTFLRILEFIYTGKSSFGFYRYY